MRNIRVGHVFPEGTLDNKDIWLEFSVASPSGEALFQTGGRAAQGNLSPESHRYGATLIDAAGQRIDKRNIGEFRVALFKRVIGPGQSDVARYRFTVPPGIDGALTLKAALRYAKVRPDYAEFTFASKRVDPLPPVGSDTESVRYERDPAGLIPELPIREVAGDTAKLAVDPDAAITPAPADLLPERWHDFGVALLLQRDFDDAARAFAELNKRYPQYVLGHVGTARLALAMGEPQKAKSALEKARAALEQSAEVDWVKHARVPALYATAQLAGGEYEDAVAGFSDVLARYPQDRSLDVDLGYALFQLGKMDESVASYRAALALDPDDGAAWSMLARAEEKRGNAEAAASAQAIFDALREEVGVQGLREQYLAKHPGDLVESEAAHVHGGW